MDAEGVVATCRDRIQFLQENSEHRISEEEACRVVAHDQFPDLCGPACDPLVCDDGRAETTGRVTGGNTVSSTFGGFVPITPSEQDSVLFFGGETTLLPNNPTRNNNNPFGPNVLLFDPSMSSAEIQATFDRIFLQQVNNEMGSERYSLYFLPGVYGSPDDPLQLQMGYYTEVAGLGAVPADVVIHGKIEVYNRCFAKDPYAEGKFIPSNGSEGLCFALNNFWRSLSNLSIQVSHKSGNTDSCRGTAMFWAISQASSMRRVDIRGSDVALMDYCSSTLCCSLCGRQHHSPLFLFSPFFRQTRALPAEDSLRTPESAGR